MLWLRHGEKQTKDLCSKLEAWQEELLRDKRQYNGNQNDENGYEGRRSCQQ
jgi:hypothetical protein